MGLCLPRQHRARRLDAPLPQHLVVEQRVRVVVVTTAAAVVMMVVGVDEIVVRRGKMVKPSNAVSSCSRSAREAMQASKSGELTVAL